MTYLADYQGKVYSDTITIASSGTVSGALDLAGRALVGFLLPATFTGTAITFQVSVDGTTYTAVYNTSNAVLSVTVTQGRVYALAPTDLLCSRYIKLVSGTTENGARSIICYSRELA